MSVSDGQVLLKQTILPIREKKVKKKNLKTVQTYTFCRQHFGSETEYGWIANSYRAFIVNFVEDSRNSEADQGKRYDHERQYQLYQWALGQGCIRGGVPHGIRPSKEDCYS